MTKLARNFDAAKRAQTVNKQLKEVIGSQASVNKNREAKRKDQLLKDLTAMVH
jgi:hypothetical protein